MKYTLLASRVNYEPLFCYKVGGIYSWNNSFPLDGFDLMEILTIKNERINNDVTLFNYQILVLESS